MATSRKFKNRSRKDVVTGNQIEMKKLGNIGNLELANNEIGRCKEKTPY